MLYYKFIKRHFNISIFLTSDSRVEYSVRHVGMAHVWTKISGIETKVQGASKNRSL